MAYRWSSYLCLSQNNNIGVRESIMHRLKTLCFSTKLPLMPWKWADTALSWKPLLMSRESLPTNEYPRNRAFGRLPVGRERSQGRREQSDWKKQQSRGTWSQNQIIKPNYSNPFQTKRTKMLNQTLSPWQEICYHHLTASCTTWNKIVFCRVSDDHSFVFLCFLFLFCFVVVAVFLFCFFAWFCFFFSLWIQKQLILMASIFWKKHFGLMWCLLFNRLLFIVNFYYYPTAIVLIQDYY